MEHDADHVRARLEALREQLKQDDAAAEADRAPVTLDQDCVGRLSRIDAIQMQAIALAASRRRQAERDMIDAALGRLERGDYGWCISCGEAIASERLDHSPAASRCISCAAR